jgi:hypothetical protein
MEVGMTARWFCSRFVGAFMATVALLAAAAAAGQDSSSASGQRRVTTSSQTAQRWTAPRTPWGDPDLQGNYTNIDELNVPIERGGSVRRQEGIPTDVDLAEFTKQSNATRRQTYEESFGRNAFSDAFNRYDLKPSRAWLVMDPPDGRIPALTAAGQERLAARRVQRQSPPESYEDLRPWERCTTRGLLWMMPSVDEPPTRIVQAPGIIAITYEMIHETRIIPLDGSRHVGPTIRSYTGDARGYWDNGSLVIETTNFRDMPNAFPPGASKDLRMIERFTPTAPNKLEWSVTFHDPSAWARPWTMAMQWTKTDEEIFEYACHEGNLVLRHLLISARVDEQLAEEAARAHGK